MNRDRLLQLLGAAHDIAAALVAFYAAYAVTLGTDLLLYSSAPHYTALFFACAASVCFSFFSLNSGAWRYASLHDLTAIIKAGLALTLVYALAEIAVAGEWQIPLHAAPLIFIFIVVTLGAPRLAYRIIKERGYLPKFTGKPVLANQRSVLLFGVNHNAEIFIRANRRAKNRKIQICGFIDDNARNGMSVQGVRVLGGLADVPDIILRLAHGGIRVNEIAVTSQDISREAINALIPIATANGLKLCRIPDISRTAAWESRPLRPDPLEISDLLGRPEVHLDAKATSKFLASKTVLITGAGGSIGSEIARQVAAFNPERLVLIDVSEYLLFLIDQELGDHYSSMEIISKIADVRDAGRMNSLFLRYKPDVVFHAAALKHVPLAETNTLECIKTNTLGVRAIADCAMKHAAECFVLISTDKAVNPTNVMGASKRAAEAYCQSLDLRGAPTRFKTVRFGNVLGSNGSVVPLFKKQIARGGPVTVTHPDMVRYFMTIPEAAKLVLKASAFELPDQRDRGCIHVLDMGEPVRIAELAEKMIELAGMRPHEDVEIRFTDIRPGEKLREDLFTPEEEGGIIKENGFYLAFARHIDERELNQAFERLRASVEQTNHGKAIEELRTIVPEYRPAGDDNGERVPETKTIRISA